MRPRLLRASLCALSALTLVACAASAGSQQAGVQAARSRLPLLDAMRLGRDLGPLPPLTQLHLTLVLAGRDNAGLTALVATGAHVPAAEYAQRFSPDPAAVQRVISALERSGLRARWTPASDDVAISGDAAAAESVFGVSVHQFVAPDGTRFSAPLQAPSVPVAFRSTVTAVLGFDTYPALRHSALAHGDGIEPSDILDLYDIAPLRSAGLDGSGITVVFPEGSVPQQNELNQYASQFGLPAFNVTTKTNQAWGAALNPGDQGFADSDGEAEMDLEIVHAIAPGAKEVVYAGANGGPDQLPVLFQAIANDFPNAVMSSSLGINDCEQSQYAADETAFDTAWKQMAGEGTTAYDASGDNGAFCEPGKVGVFPDVASPDVTAVGGTTVFQAGNGGYAGEAAWGDPVDQGGGGGGVSNTFTEPSWQTGPGVDTHGSNGMRQVPDVAGPADPISGWATVNSQGAQEVAGTSAAAPFWAGITALIYQDLAQKHLSHPGLLAPVLYFFAQNPSGLPEPPFHDVTTGTNLYYAAQPGWDFATGLGSPDAARLADDLEWYETAHPQGNGT
ncbi:MAG: S8/S53 family peptidase [Candidatus Dormibacteraeota bacterium]|nr:S8/S53 family peptidase [Candidatus Dormibacteraeota bacterium]